MTPEIVKELSRYFLKMANKKRKKDSENNGDDDYDINPNIKINMENILDDDSITPENLEELSKSFFKQANGMRSKQMKMIVKIMEIMEIIMEIILKT